MGLHPAQVPFPRSICKWLKKSAHQFAHIGRFDLPLLLQQDFLFFHNGGSMIMPQCDRIWLALPSSKMVQCCRHRQICPRSRIDVACKTRHSSALPLQSGHFSSPAQQAGILPQFQLAKPPNNIQALWWNWMVWEDLYQKPKTLTCDGNLGFLLTTKEMSYYCDLIKVSNERPKSFWPSNRTQTHIYIHCISTHVSSFYHTPIHFVSLCCFSSI